MADYEVYGVPTKVDPEARRWRVLVEYANQGQAKPPTIVRIGTTVHVSHTEALAEAERTARTYEPPDPFSIQSRQVYADGTDRFLVVLEGLTSTFHMSVRLVVPLEPQAASSDPDGTSL